MLLMSSCRTTYNVSLQPELEEMFVQRTYSDIVDVLGAPDRIVSDGTGGQIIVYEDMNLNTVGSVNPWTGRMLMVTKSSKGYVQMYLNGENICYRIKTNREKEVSEFSRGKTIGLISGIVGGYLMCILLNYLSQFER